MSSHWNSRRGSIASPLIRMAASFSSGKGLPFFISVLLSLSLSPYLFLAPSLSLRQGNSSLGINPLQIRLKHWVIIWPTGCSDQSSKACVCVCQCVYPCLFVYLWHVKGVQSLRFWEDSIPLSRNKMGNPIPLISLSFCDSAWRLRHDQSQPDILTLPTSLSTNPPFPLPLPQGSKCNCCCFLQNLAD